MTQSGTADAGGGSQPDDQPAKVQVVHQGKPPPKPGTPDRYPMDVDPNENKL